MKVEEWTTVRSVVDVADGARVLLISLLAGVKSNSAPKPERYLDDVHVRLITQEAPLP